MPVITVECSAMDRETKALLIRELTAKASEVTKISPQAFTIVIHENGSDNIGVGGKVLTEIMKGS